MVTGENFKPDDNQLKALKQSQLLRGRERERKTERERHQMLKGGGEKRALRSDGVSEQQR